MTNQLQRRLAESVNRIIELEADNNRLREAIAEAEAHLSIHVCKNEDNQEIVAAHLLSLALSQPTLTTGLLELAAAGLKTSKEVYDVPEYLHEAAVALPPEVRQLLEDMA